MIGGATRLVFLAGDPIAHTKGYAEYATALHDGHIDAVYLPAHVPAGHLRRFLAGLSWASNVAGVVATIPHKLEALEAAIPDASARRAGSANVLRRRPDGQWECTQVDGAGFLAAIDAAQIGLNRRHVQVLGAGGAGRAVAMSIAERQPAELCIHDPDIAKQNALVEAVRREFPEIPTRAGLERSEVLVNCSSVGMGNDERLPLPPDLIPIGGACYDVVNRADTMLLRMAEQRQCKRDHGRSMMLAEIPHILDYFFNGRRFPHEIRSPG